MKGDHLESSKNSAPAILQHFIRKEFDSCNLRVTRPSEECTGLNVDGCMVSHHTCYEDLQCKETSETTCSRKDLRSSNCRADSMDTSLSTANQREDKPDSYVGDERSMMPLFTLLGSDNAIHSKSKPTDILLQVAPFSGRREMSSIHDSSSVHGVLNCSREHDKIKEYIDMHFTRIPSSRFESPLKENFATSGTLGKCWNVPSTSEAHNFCSKVKLNSISYLYATVENDYDGLLFTKQLEKQDPFSSKDCSLSFHGHSMGMVSRWRKTKITSENEGVLGMKRDYWMIGSQKGEIFKQFSSQTSTESLFPVHGRKLELDSFPTLWHEAQEKPLFVGGEMRKSTNSGTQDGKKLSSLIPSWIENNFLARGDKKTGVFQAGCDKEGTTRPIESTGNGHQWITTATCNHKSSSIIKTRICQESIECKDEEWEPIAGPQVDRYSASSAGTDETSTCCYLSKNSSKCECKTQSASVVQSQKTLIIIKSDKIKWIMRGATPVKSNKDAKVKISVEEFVGTDQPAISYYFTMESNLHDNTEEQTCYADENTISMADTEPNVSRTVTIGLDLASYVKKQAISNLGMPCENALDPSSRWVKRLKLHSVDSFALGTKSFKIDDAPNNRRIDKLYTRVLNYSRPDSNFTSPACQHKMEKSRVESLKKSHAWIRRWCTTSQEDNNTLYRKRCGSESAKVAFENLEGKQLPSIAAMALMGKAATNFRPCEFRRRGPSVVWNTEGF